MTPNISTLAKKTKAEILNEYTKLASNLEQAKAESYEINEPSTIEMVTSAKSTFTTTGVESAISELRVSTTEKLTHVAKKITDTLDTLARQTLDGVEKFATLTRAIEISEKRLTTLYRIEVVATTLEALVKEYEDKKQQLELEHSKQHNELAESIALKKRDHEREEEVYAYTLKTKRTREEEEYGEKAKKKIAGLEERERALKEEESVVTALRSQIENLPAQNEKLIQTTEQEVTKRLTTEHTTHTDALTKVWESEKRILELKYTNLEMQYKKLESEMNQMKKEVETAQKRAQELAITIIEHGSGHTPSRSDVRDSEISKS